MAEDNSPTPSTNKTGSSFIQKKVGPFPMWAWVVIGGAAIGIYILIRSRGSSTGTSTVGTQAGGSVGTGVTSTDPLTADQLLQQMQQLSGQIGQTSSSVQSVIATARPGYSNNQVAIWSAPTTASSVLQIVDSGTKLAVAGSNMQGGTFGGYTDTGGAPVPVSNEWTPVTTSDGKQGFIWAPDAPAWTGA